MAYEQSPEAVQRWVDEQYPNIAAGAGTDTFAGALVRRGEATAIVTATGPRTKFGRTAELVRFAREVSTQQRGRPPDYPQPGGHQ
jgi:magnesium-transporting ATPase (P-type)